MLGVPLLIRPVGDQRQQSGAQTLPLGKRPISTRRGTPHDGHDLLEGGEVGGDVNKLMVQNKSGKPLYLMPG